MLTPRQLEILARMEDDGEELVVEGREVWIGYERTTPWTVRALLRVCAISDVSDVKGLERYAINGTGRAIRADPSLAYDVAQMLRTGGSFTIQNGAIVPL